MGGMKVERGEGVVNNVLIGGDGEGNLSNLFLKILKESAVTTEARSLSQYFMSLNEKADPLLRRR